MAIGTGANTQISYVAEVTKGTTPATPAFSKLSINDFGTGLQKEIFTDSSIKADRQSHFMKHGNKSVSGDITVTMLLAGASPTGNQMHDPLLASGFNSSWVSNVLKFGNTNSSFTVEKHLIDTSGNSNYFRWKGVEVESIGFEVGLNAPVTVKYGLMGLSEDPITSTAITGATYVNEPNQQPVVHINANNQFKEGGSATTLMTSFKLDIKNGAMLNHALGNADGIAITNKSFDVSGEATYYFSDATLYNKFINETSSTLEIKLSDGTNSLTFLLPNIVYSGAEQVISNDETLIVTMPFTAIYDASEATSVKITRA